MSDSHEIEVPESIKNLGIRPQADWKEAKEIAKQRWRVRSIYKNLGVEGTVALFFEEDRQDIRPKSRKSWYAHICLSHMSASMYYSLEAGNLVEFDVSSTDLNTEGKVELPVDFLMPRKVEE